jgi:ABC-type multidrug transport system fused ATPase/permease subunit
VYLPSTVVRLTLASYLLVFHHARHRRSGKRIPHAWNRPGGDGWAETRAGGTLRPRLHKSFGSVETLRGIPLTAHEHEVIAILGSSGSGKSAFLRCINLAAPFPWFGHSLLRVCLGEL